MELVCIPKIKIDLSEIPETSPSNGLPEKSKEIYVKTYEALKKWKHLYNISDTSESVLLLYFKDLSDKYKPTFLWTIYSLLISTINLNESINIEAFDRLQDFLKEKFESFQPKQAKICSPDAQYLAIKFKTHRMESFTKKRKYCDKNRAFHEEWTALYAFIRNPNNQPACLICKHKLSTNKKSNIQRHFSTKHSTFAQQYPVGESRRKAVLELLRSVNSTAIFKNFRHSSNITNMVKVEELAEHSRSNKPLNTKRNANKMELEVCTEEQPQKAIEVFANHLTNQTELDIFGKMVAIKIRKLNPHNQAIAQNQIQNCLFGLEMEELSDSPTESVRTDEDIT